MWGHIQQLFLMVNTREEKDKVRATKVGGRGNYMGSWPQFPACSKSAILLFGYCRYYKCSLSGWKSFGPLVRGDAISKWVQDSQNVFVSPMFMVKECNQTAQKQETTLRVWPGVSVWGVGGHTRRSPGNQDMGFLSRFRRFGLYLKQEFPEEALNWGCPKWPAWWHQHRLLMRQESLQAQVQVLFCSGHFSPVFHNQTKSILKSVLQWCKPPLPHHC